MLQRFCFILTMLGCLPLMAQQFDGPHNDIEAMSADYLPRITYSSGTAFTAVQMDATRTIDPIRCWGWRYMQLSLAFVYATANREVTMTCEQANDKTNGPWYTIEDLEWDSTNNKKTSTQGTWSKTPTASANWTWTVRLNAYPWCRCSFAVASGTTSNTLGLAGRLME